MMKRQISDKQAHVVFIKDMDKDMIASLASSMSVLTILNIVITLLLLFYAQIVYLSHVPTGSCASEAASMRLDPFPIELLGNRDIADP